MITIGVLAKKYGQLPSQVVAHATSYDLMVDDVLTTWENYQQDPSSANNYDQNELEELIKGVRG
jgi:hypothetical protein